MFQTPNHLSSGAEKDEYERRALEELYSPIQTRDSKEANRTKEVYWKSEIRKYLLERISLTFDKKDIAAHFIIDGLIPDSLHDVFVRCKDDFLDASDLTSVLSLKSPFAFWSLLMPKREESSSDRTLYVPLIQQISDLIKGYASGLNESERVLLTEELPDFTRSFPVYLKSLSKQVEVGGKNPELAIFLEKIPNDREEFDVLLTYLKHKNIIVMADDQSSLQILLDHEKHIKAVPTVLKQILTMRKNVHMTELAEQELEVKKMKETAKAKQYMAKNDKQQAISCLRLRKLFNEKQLEKLSFRMELEKILLHIDDPTLKMVQEAMQQATLILRTRKKDGSTLEHVEKMMDEFNDEMEDLHELTDALQTKLALSNDETDEQDLNDELAALLEQQMEQTVAPLDSLSITGPSLPLAPTADLFILNSAPVRTMMTEL